MTMGFATTGIKRVLSGIVLLAVSSALLAEAQQAKVASAVENLIRAKDYAGAAAAARKALQQSPKDVQLWTLDGIALSLKGDAQEAITAFEGALRLSPNFSPALKGEVQLLYPKGDKRAVPLLERILKLNADDAIAHEMLGNLYATNGNCEGAIAQFDTIPQVVGEHAASLQSDGSCLMELKRYSEAIPIFEKLAALLPHETYPKYDLAVAQVTDRQYEEARKTIEPLLEAKTQDPDVLSLASEINEALGRTPEAVSLLRQAIILDPKVPDYYVLFATICLDHDSFQTGIEMMDVGLKQIPDAPAVYISRGLLHAQLAQYDAAEADFRKAEQLDSSQSLSSYALDLAEMQKNNPEGALKQVEAQLKEHPESPLLNFLLAKLIMDQTPAAESPAFKRAMECAQRATKMKPDLVEAHNLLASMDMSTGHYDLAIEQSRTALKYAPEDETATFHLVIALRHAGQKEELPALVKRLAQLHQDSMKKETDRKRYRLELVQSPPGV